MESIISGLREKKGHAITLLDLRALHERPADYMIIAESNSPTGLSTLEDSIRETVRRDTGERPVRVHKGSGEWIAMDFVDVLVHLFTPDLRAYYRLEQMWEDARVTRFEEVI